MKFLGKVSQLESVGCLHQTSTLVNILEQILVQLSHFLEHNNWLYLKTSNKFWDTSATYALKTKTNK